MTQTRIYVVASAAPAGDPIQRLVDATSAAQAIRHCAKGIYQASVANTKQVVALMSKGVAIEKIDEGEAQ